MVMQAQTINGSKVIGAKWDAKAKWGNLSFIVNISESTTIKFLGFG